MGSSCCKLIIHACKRPITMRAKIAQLYNVNPGLNEEFHAKYQAQKLFKYLSDHPQKVGACCKHMSSTYISALEKTPAAADLRVVTITLHALRGLIDLAEFVPVAYHLCDRLLRHALYQQVSQLLFELLNVCTRKHPGLAFFPLESILSHLIDVDHSVVTHEQAATIGNICVILREDIQADETWRTILKLALHLGFKGDCELMSVIAGVMGADEHYAVAFFKSTIEYLNEKKWDKQAVCIFEAVLQSRVNHLILFKELLENVSRLIARPRQFEWGVRCLLLVLHRASTTLSLSSLTDLHNVLVAISNSSFLPLGGELLQNWGLKTDQLSLFNLLKIFMLNSDPRQPESEWLRVLISMLRASSQSESFKACLFGFIQELLSRLEANPGYVKYISKLLKLGGEKPNKDRVLRINAYLLRLVGQFEVPSGGYGHLMKIWDLLAHIRTKKSLMLSLVVSLGEMLDSAPGKHNLYIAVCMMGILHRLADPWPGLKKLMRKAGEEVEQGLKDGVDLFSADALERCTQRFTSDMFSGIETNVRPIEVDRIPRRSSLNDPMEALIESEKSSIISEDRIELFEVKGGSEDYYNYLVAHERERDELVNRLISS